VGNPATATLALELARRGGTVVWFGVSPPGATATVEPYVVYRKELTIRGAFVNPNTFGRALDLLAHRRIHERVGAHAGLALIGKVSPEEAVKAAAKEVRDILGKATVKDQPAPKP
jgi:threonine dehydrogenase-like Zn-dependent dehydrogenase